MIFTIYFDLAKVIPAPEGALPVPIRMNIEENREKFDAALEGIAKATGSLTNKDIKIE